jgi:hypothetical protein
VEEGIFYVKLLNELGTKDSHGEHRVNSGRFYNRDEGLVVVDSGALSETPKDPTGLVAIKGPVSTELVRENSLAGDNVGALRSGNQLSDPIADQGPVFVLHNRTPMGISKRSMSGGGDRGRRQGRGRRGEDKTIRHHLEASLAPCDHPMWIIWGRDRYHHALSVRGRARRRGRWSGTRLLAAPGPPRVPVAPAPTSRLRVASGPPRVAAAPTPTSRRRVAPGAPRVPEASAPSARLGAAPGAAPAPISRRGAAPGSPCVPTAAAPTSRRRAAPGAPRVPVAPAPISRRRAAMGAPRGPTAPTAPPDAGQL